jgi:TRAP-type C4-dicarboxylate transport system permease small subunit
VNNLTRGRVTQLDGTNNMLLLGFLGWLGIQAAALLPMFSDEWPIWSVLMALTVFGLGGVFRSIRELVLINRAGKWVAYP